MSNISKITETKKGKILLSLWLVAIFVLIALPLLGSFQNEMAGNLAFSFIICSALINFSIIISYNVKAGSEKIAKVIWICLGGIILGFILFSTYNLAGRSDKEIGIVMSYIMLVYSFPIGLLVSLLFGGIIYISDKYYPVANDINIYLGLLFIWGIFFISGYIQWFKLLPVLIEKWRNKRS